MANGSLDMIEQGSLVCKIRMWADAEVLAAQSNIGDTVCESSVIPFLVPRHKVWMTAAA